MAITLTKRSAFTVALLAAALGAGVVGLGSGLASADNTNIKPDPWVDSPQGKVRKNATQGEVRGGEVLAPAGGSVTESPIAVPGTKARGFKGVRVGPPIGGW
ncbi:hypothetical protein Mycch_1267 [Mycolicibacterium chubuense NBB4]|uniref:MspA n=1 Tax=Mycolicibacterium chubuense (strain NBB4) TaxID=710421 RepID=I4BFL8_MYCCN|nr:hypothetical protein [Mycolicibacterium chubuense]AFM16075.1 hypothetical protein Mycch_1267 [Mycolicibacterium chubuense NBB4]